MLSKYEWDQLQQLSYNVMPEWGYNREQRDARYEAYEQASKEWQEKESKGWGSPSVDME